MIQHTTSFLVPLMLLATSLVAHGAQAPEAAPANPGIQRQASLVLKVADHQATAADLIQKATALGGYFSSLTNDKVVLKVPVAHMDLLLDHAITLGVVADRQRQIVDRTSALHLLNSQLASKKSLLERYFAILVQSRPEAVVQVERSLSGVVGEMEAIQGRIRFLEHQTAMATVSISFQFRDRAAPVRDGRSSFPWLNSINLVDLVEDFGHAY